MRKGILIAAIACLISVCAFAHVTPNVQLVQRGDFVKATIPGATQFFDRTLDAIGFAEVRKATGWTPTSQDLKIYVGRNEGKELVGTVVFIWMPSEHGPVGIGVAFNQAGIIIRSEVTDCGSEPLTWVQQLINSGAMHSFDGMGMDGSPAPEKMAPQVTGTMNRYYAKVLTGGVTRAQEVMRTMLRK